MTHSATYRAISCWISGPLCCPQSLEGPLVLICWKRDLLYILSPPSVTTGKAPDTGYTQECSPIKQVCGWFQWCVVQCQFLPPSPNLNIFEIPEAKELGIFASSTVLGWPQCWFGPLYGS